MVEGRRGMAMEYADERSMVGCSRRAICVRADKFAWQAWGQGQPKMPVQCVVQKMALDVRSCFHWEDRNDPSQGCSRVPKVLCSVESRLFETVSLGWVCGYEDETAEDGVLSLQLPC